MVAALALAFTSAIIIGILATIVCTAVSLFYWRSPSEKASKGILSSELPAGVESMIQTTNLPKNLGNPLAMGYASIVEHLLGMEFWTQVWKANFTPLPTFEEYMKSFGRMPSTSLPDKLYIEQSMRWEAEVREGYGYKVAERAMLADFELETGKMQAFVLPEFQAMIPDKYEEIKALVLDNLKQTKTRLETMNEMFLYSLMMMPLRELNLLDNAVFDLEKLFPKDEAVKLKAKAMRQMIEVLREKLRVWNNKDRREFMGV